MLKSCFREYLLKVEDMEGKPLTSLTCIVLLVTLSMCVEAQTLSHHADWDHSSLDGVGWHVDSESTEVGTNTWIGNDSYEVALGMSSSYPSDESFDKTGRRNTTGNVPLTWLWQPITWSWWVIMQMITALLGIVGNLLVITVLFQRRKKSRSTDTLVGALAVADLFTSIFMIPLPSPDRVPPTMLGEFYCKVIYTSMFMWVSVNASIATLTFIPIERYIAVKYPFRCKELLARRRIASAIIDIWLIAFLLNSFLFWIASVNPSAEQCSVIYPRGMQIVLGVVLFLVQFLIPAILSLTLQILTARALHRQSRLQLGEEKRLDRSNPSTRHIIARKRVLQTLFIVVLLFLICWGPSQILYLAFNLGIVPDTYPYSPFNRAITILGFCNSCANPIVYTVRYPEFRQAMKLLFSPARRSDVPLFGDREFK